MNLPTRTALEVRTICLTSGEVCELAGCLPPTLYSWHCRNGLLPHLRGRPSSKWTRYSLSDALAVCVLVLLTKNGMVAQQAVHLANSLRPHLERAIWHNGELLIGICFRRRQLEFQLLSGHQQLLHELGFFDDAIITLINLHEIYRQMVTRSKRNEND